MLCCLLIMHIKLIVQDELGQFSTSQEKLLDTAKVNFFIVFHKRRKRSLKH